MPDTPQWRNVMRRDADGKLVSVHTLPIGDLCRHTQSELCWCAPKLDNENGCEMWIHNSSDGRELVEKHGVN